LDHPDLAEDSARPYWAILKRRLTKAIAKWSFEFYIDADVSERPRCVAILRQRMGARLVEELIVDGKSWNEGQNPAGNAAGKALL
jgi:hypothetical protein